MKALPTSQCRKEIVTFGHAFWGRVSFCRYLVLEGEIKMRAVLLHMFNSLTLRSVTDEY